MKQCCTVFFLLLVSALSAYSQKEAANWYFGERTGLTFKRGYAEVLKGGKVITYEGCAAISDKITGELLFYTDGVTVWNSRHGEMTNGTGLKSGYSSTQNTLIVPNPINDKLYYIFTAPDLTSTNFDPITTMYYSEVNMENPDGIVQKKNIPLMDSVSEKLTGTITCEDGGYWVLAHHRTKAIFYAYRIKESIDTVPVISDFSNEYSTAFAGSMKFSPDGTKIATAVNVLSTIAPPTLFLYSFNKRTGAVENRKKIDSYPPERHHLYEFYGLSFSPDNTKLYASGFHNIVQYDVTLKNEIAIKNSKTEIAKGDFLGMQLAPDKKIYVSRMNNFLYDIFSIEKPNEEGENCNLVKSKLDVSIYAGFPNFMDYIFADNYEGDCLHQFSTLEDINLCVGNVFTLTHKNSRNMVNRKWIIENADILSEQDSIIIGTIHKTGKHKVTLTFSLKGLTDTLHCYINVNSQKPIANAGKDIAVCLVNDSVSTAIGAPSDADNIYSWMPTTGLNNPKSSNPVVTLNENRTYILTVTNKWGCFAYDTVTVSVLKNNIKTNNDMSLCIGGTAQLSVMGSSTYIWSPGASLDDSTSANPIAKPTKTTVYKVVGDNGTCKDSAYVTIYVSDYPIVSDTVEDKTTCPGIPIQIGNPAEKDYTYSWFPPLYLDNPTLPQPICTPLEDIHYILTIRNPFGCPVYDTIIIHTGGGLPLRTNGDRPLCLGDKTQLSAEGAETYEWTPHEGLDNPTVFNPIANPQQTTRYYVKGKKGTCYAMDSVLITVVPKPEIMVDMPDTVLCAGDKIILKASGGDYYRWTPPLGLETPDSSHTMAQPPHTMEYTVEGIKNGCASTKKILVKVLDNDTFPLQLILPDNTYYRPGDIVPLLCRVPDGFSEIVYTIHFQSCCIVYHTMGASTVNASITESNDSSITIRVISNDKKGGDIVLNFIPLLPPDKRLKEQFDMEIQYQSSQCIKVYGTMAELLYDKGCAWDMRGVREIGKSDIHYTGEQAILSTGWGGSTTVSIYDMTGQEIWNKKEIYPASTEQSIPLPTLMGGAYILRAKNYVWKKDILIVKE